MSFENIHLQWFAAEDEGRTEEPSETKLKKAREEGRIPKSQDLVSSVTFFISVLILLVLAKGIFSSCIIILRFFFLHIADETFSYSQMWTLFVQTIFRSGIPIAIVCVVGGIAINLVENRGFLITTKKIKPDFSRLVPRFLQYFKNKVFSSKGAENILIKLFKVIFIGFVAYFLIKKDMEILLMEIQNRQILECVSRIGNMVFQFLMIISILFLMLGIIDFYFQKRFFKQEMKMTKQEVKQEFKEMEGDPEVKRYLSEAQKKLLQQNIPKAVKESDVVITNPTHYAVSLKFDMDVDISPKVTAKGVDEIALKMKQIAKENDVPTVENRPLARDLYASTDINQSIPEDYWSILATIYAEIDKFKIKS